MDMAEAKVGTSDVSTSPPIRPDNDKAVQNSAHASGNHLHKHKRRNHRKINTAGEWSEPRRPQPLRNCAPPADYNNMIWQQSTGVQQPLLTPNGQRLFTAVSDPSVCGYSPIPMTYAMEPVSMPPVYQFYQPIPRPGYQHFRGRPRRNHAQIHLDMVKNVPPIHTNGYSSLQENHFNYAPPVAHQNGDYASLPPAANIENGTGGEELNSEHRRYSDPGLGPAQLPIQSQSEDSESLESGSSTTTVGRSNKLILSLIEQVTALKENNGQLFKELHETKSELENVKVMLSKIQQSTFADYQPGMLSDIVRDMREAAKVREESMISKVKAVISERQSLSAESSSSNELEILKDQLAKMTLEKIETQTRLAKVEQELATLKLNANHEGQEIVALEEETLTLRRELQEARASRTSAEHQAAKLEKLVGILHKQMNGASAEETVELVAHGIKSNNYPTGVGNIVNVEENPPASTSSANKERTSSNSNRNSSDDRITNKTSDDNDIVGKNKVDLVGSSDDESNSKSNHVNSSILSVDRGNAHFSNLSGASASSGPVTDL